MESSRSGGGGSGGGGSGGGERVKLRRRLGDGGGGDVEVWRVVLDPLVLRVLRDNGQGEGQPGEPLGVAAAEEMVMNVGVLFATVTTK